MSLLLACTPNDARKRAFRGSLPSDVAELISKVWEFGGSITAGPPAPEGSTMAKSQKKSNKEVRKPKAEKVKTIAANASTKDKPVNMVNIKS